MNISKEELLKNFLGERISQFFYVKVDDQSYDITLTYLPLKDECNFICAIEDVAREVQFLLIQSPDLKEQILRVNVFHFNNTEDCFQMTTLSIKIVLNDNPSATQKYTNILPPRIEGVGSHKKNIERYECKLLSFDSYAPEQRLSNGYRL